MSGRGTILSFREDCDFSRELRKEGFEVLNLPLVATRTAVDLSHFQERAATIDRFDWIFVTSPAAAAVLANEFGRGLVKTLPKVYVLGRRAKTLLESCGIAVEYSDTASTADDLLAELGESGFRGKTILFLRGNKSLRTIRERLRGIATVEEAVVYDTIEVPIRQSEILDRVRAGQIGWMCFFSPSAVESYVGRQLPIGRDISRIAVIGETTGQTARSLGFSVDFVSDRASAVDFARGLAKHIKNIE